MGVNASNYPHSFSQRVGGNSQAQQTFIGTSSYLHQGYGCESKLYSLEHSHEKPQDKKKKSSGLATLKKKFIKRRKSNRSADHAKQMRELLSGWDVRDVNALVEEYEGTAALKELSLQGNLARPDARTLQRDLADLYEYKYCTDVDLIFQDTCFPVHRAILAARCPFFKMLLSSSPEYGAEIMMDINTAGIDLPMFSALLHYLYTGEFGIEDSRFQNVDILVQLTEEFGTPNSLDVDMRELFDNMCYYDAILGFSSDSQFVEAFGRSSGCLGEELCGHKAVLSARSPFFRNLLQRRIRTGEEITDRTLQTPTRIILDESIIPKKYAKVILHCMYTDLVDLSLVLHCNPSVGSLSEVQAMVAGKGNMSRAEEAMELYHIALFLEFNMLAQGCEDIVMESISLDTLISILKWSSQPYGSKWVYRQAINFLCEEFTSVMTSDVFFELSMDYLPVVLQSDYLQASEQDILKYMNKWGEHQLIKQMAEREPNLLSGTAHSVNKRGVKRRDLDIEELKEILSPVLPHIRIDHILPTNSEILNDAIKRGLISTPPSDMLPTAEGGKSHAWLRQKNSGIYVKPRLFAPYVEEAKTVLDEMMVEQTDLVRLRMVRMSNVPDTLYMVNSAVPQCCHLMSHQPIGVPSNPPSIIANEIPVPPLKMVKDMIRRLQELRHTDQVQRAYALNCGEGATVSYEIQIRVLREFNLPDAAVELLQNPHKFFPHERFGDESPVLAIRQHGHCRMNSSPAGEHGDIEPYAAFHPPLPPPPPPYHPPAASTHEKHKIDLKQRLPGQLSSRSLSYPCNRSLHYFGLNSRPIYTSGGKLMPPDCTNSARLAQIQTDIGNAEGALNELMPDIAVGVTSLSNLSLKDRRFPEPALSTEVNQMASDSASFPRPAPYLHSKYAHGVRRKPSELKAESREGFQEYPDLYDFSIAACRPYTPGTSRHTLAPSQRKYFGPDLYCHSRPAAGSFKMTSLCSDTSGKPVESRREYLLPPEAQQPRPSDPPYFDFLEQPPHRLDLALKQESSGGSLHTRSRGLMETDLTYGLSASHTLSVPCSSENREASCSRRSSDGDMLEPGPSAQHHRNIRNNREDTLSRERRSPNRPDLPYKKSAL
ncbi:BTB/POZ domain-containing protein 7 [Pristis pectinata]|uniref:BTB/POZ domain-containing protein 7 n=1 Tax=Pristis pectinata TaxID=685728 RepID=UPI00223CF0F0|nr:BTB/POZ domain-containing protein 7 [Pristis pectinata]